MFHKITLLGKGMGVLSCLQIESYGANIIYRSGLLSAGSRDLIVLLSIALDFRNDLQFTADGNGYPSRFRKIMEDIVRYHKTSKYLNEDEDFNKYGWQPLKHVLTYMANGVT